MIHSKFHDYIKKWSLTVGFMAMMMANVAAFFVIDAHHDETAKWQAKYCTTLQSGRHELRTLVLQLSESTTNETVRLEMQEFLDSYPEIDC